MDADLGEMGGIPLRRRGRGGRRRHKTTRQKTKEKRDLNVGRRTFNVERREGEDEEMNRRWTRMDADLVEMGGLPQRRGGRGGAQRGMNKAES